MTGLSSGGGGCAWSRRGAETGMSSGLGEPFGLLVPRAVGEALTHGFIITVVQGLYRDGRDLAVFSDRASFCKLLGGPERAA